MKLVTHGLGLRRRRAAVLACAVAGMTIASSAFAVERTWISSTSRFFHDTGAWSGAVVPGAADNARFNLDATYSVLFVTSPTNQLATFSNGTVGFDLGNQTYTLSSTTSPLVVGTLNLFSTFDAHLNIASEGGTLQTQSTSIGNVRGPGTVSVGSTAWNSAGTLTVGSGGLGTVIISSGGVVTAAGTVKVGDAGNGTLLIGSGGVVNCTSATPPVAIAAQAGSRGYVGISAGGRWTTSSDIRVGDVGAGTIVIDSGILSGGGSLYVAPQSGASGYVSMINAGTMSFPGDAIIGGGSISIGGGVASFRGMNIGALNGATGTLAISGGNTTANSNVYVGGGSFGSIWAGVLSVSAGSFGTTHLLKNWNTGVIHLSGGLLSAATLDFNTGSLDWTGGTLQVTRDLIIGAGGAISAMTIPSGGQLYSLGTLTVSSSLTSTGGNLYAGQGIHLISGGTITLDHCVGQTGTSFVDSIGGTFIVRGGGYANLGGDSEVVSGGLLQIEQAGNWSDPVLNGNHFSVASGATLSIASGGRLTAGHVAIGGVGTITDSGSKLVAPLLTITGTLTAKDSAAISSGSIDIPTGGSLTIGSGCSLSTQSMLFVGGSATLGIDPDPTHIGTLTINSGDPVSRVSFSSKAHVGTLTLTSGRAQETAGSNSMLVLRNLTVNTANGAALDLANNKAILEYSVTTPLPTIRSLIITGRNGGTWDGAGITSASAAATNGATAIGYAEAFALFNSFPNTFAGESIDSTAVLVCYTYTGDANLDGTVDLTDFTFLAANFNGTNKDWHQGDFNYDGKVDLTDFTYLASNFNQSLPAGGAGASGAAVPEPGVIGLTLLVAGFRLRRRRTC